MTKKPETYDINAIVHANASLFREGAKIGYLQMVHIIVGFAHGTSIMACSDLAKTHRDTVRDIYEALRERLLTPRFDKWVQSSYASPERNAEDDAAIMIEAKTALFGCHKNTDCFKRYRAGRRKTRVCRACPIRSYAALFDEVPREAGVGWVGGRQPTLGNANGGFEKQIEDLVEIVDRMRAFYRQLGWKESNADTDPRSVFEKRFRHYEVFSTAVGHSKFDDTCKVISTEDDFLSIPHLAKTIFDDLKSDPIR